MKDRNILIVGNLVIYTILAGVLMENMPVVKTVFAWLSDYWGVIACFAGLAIWVVLQKKSPYKREDDPSYISDPRYNYLPNNLFHNFFWGDKE